MAQDVSEKLFWDDVKAIFKSYKGQMLRVGILSGFLIFLLNIVLGISFYAKGFNEEIKGKLGMYFYIVDDAQRQSEIDKQVMELKEELKNAGLEVKYSTKEDALNFLKKSLPALSGNFERFGLENPLPATLYITFNDQTEYELLQTKIAQYQEIILNHQDATKLETLESQETRILHIINLSNFIQMLCRILVAMLMAVILSFAIFFLKGLLMRFREDIQVKKLLGARKNQIIRPFLASISYAVLGGFVLAGALVVASLFTFDYFMMQAFGFALIPLLLQEWSTVLSVVLGEILLVMLPLMAISYHFILTLHKKLK